MTQPSLRDALDRLALYDEMLTVIADARQALGAVLPVVEAATVVAERLACMHDFDPECARCEWMWPLRKALREVPGTGSSGDRS